MRRRILFGVFILNGKFDPFTMQITIVIIEGIVISPLAKREREVTRDWETINFITRTLQCNDTFVALFRSNSLTLDIIIYTLYVGNLNFFFLLYFDMNWAIWERRIINGLKLKWNRMKSTIEWKENLNFLLKLISSFFC